MADWSAKISRRDGLGMVTLRGKLRSDLFQGAVMQVTGCDVPERLRIVRGGDWQAAWMSSDEIFLIGPREGAGQLMSELSRALKSQHHLVVDVSDARSVFRIEGAGARAIISKGAPVNMSAGAFSLGDFRRTRLGQVAVSIWMSEPEAFDLMCFASNDDYVVAWLETTAVLEGLTTDF